MSPNTGYTVKIDRSGLVVVYTSTGRYVHTFNGPARSAAIVGDEVHITTPDNTVKIYKVTGRFIHQF